MNCQAGNDNGIGKKASGAGIEMGLYWRGIFLLLIAQPPGVVQNEINTEHKYSPELIFFFFSVNTENISANRVRFLFW